MNRQALPGPARLLLLMAGCFLKESMIHKVLFTATMFFLLAVPAYAAIEPQSWQFTKQVQAQKDGFALIELDAEVLGHTRDDLADIKLSDAAGQEVPYQLLQPEFYKEETFPVQLIDNVVQENEFSSVTLDLQTGDHRHNRIQLDLESKEDYLRDVKIEGSADNRTWNLISSQKVFYVSPNYRQNDLSYPTASFRYMRVTIDSKGKNPLNIRGAKVKYVQDAGGLPLAFKGPDGPPALRETGDAAWHADSTSARAGSIIPSTLLSSRTDTRTNQTELIIDLGTKGYLINYIALQVDGGNFNRLINYYDTNDNRWRHLGQERIYHYQWPDYEASKNTLLLNYSGARFIKLVLYNQDSPPLNVENVIVWGDHQKILADLRQGSYTLWYSNSNSKAPQYDLSQFAQLVDKSQLAVLQPGHESVNANYRPKLTDNRWFLNIVTLLAALAIGLIILKNMKRKGN
ncbi:MAG: F5/8 type C domain protein [Pelotomaculum sp. PtaB.Bin104]|nr:MAG: F5/8 type C domain protein [Pelotomaculum sp. PtaB.Bin104]